MGRIMGAVRRHIIATAAGTAVVLGGAGVGTAALITTSSTSPGQVYEAPAATPTTSSTPQPDAPAPDTQPVEEPRPATGAATVDAVTAPDSPSPDPQVGEPAAPTPDAPPTTSSYDPAAPWTDSTGLTYIPAPPVPVDPLNGEDVVEPD